MTGRQFMNSAMVWLLERTARRLPWVAKGLLVLSDWFFPRLFDLPVPQRLKRGVTRASTAWVYLFLLIAFLVVQGVWAHSNGVFLPDGDGTSKHFLEDVENLTNYFLIIPAYVLLGYAFLAQVYRINDDLIARGVGVEQEPPSQSAWRRGFLAALALFVFGLWGAGKYAEEVETYASTYWFHATPPTSPGGATFDGLGYYYLFGNVVLLLFVLWVALAHFELVRVGYRLHRYFRPLVEDPSRRQEAQSWLSERQAQERLEPLANAVMVSKGFVAVLFVNMVTWKANEPNREVAYVVATVLLVVFGLLVFSLPRYAVQLQIFRIHQKYGEEEKYIDIRRNWLRGASGFVNLVVLSAAVSYLLGEEMRAVIDLLFE